MKKPTINKLSVEDENVLFENSEIIVSEKNGNLKISSKKEKRSILADVSDWYEYGLHVFTPESAKKAMEIMFDYDSLFENEREEKNKGKKFNPVIFKLLHKQSGFFSKKGNRSADPSRDENGDWNQKSFGWSKNIGATWSRKKDCILHIRNIIRYNISASYYDSSEEYYKIRDSFLDRYIVLAIDNEGNTEKYEANSIVPRTESSINWVDFEKFSNIRKIRK